MVEDAHQNTGEYDPETYWDQRALHAQERELLQAVCVLGATEQENKCADRVQRHLIESAVRQVGFDLLGRDVLEYGCGVGRWKGFFGKYSCAWKGVDLAENMLRIARSRYPEAEFKKIHGNRIPYPGRSFDLVYSITVVHHNPYEQQEEILSEMVRVLREDGYLILLEDVGEGRGNRSNMFPRSRSEWVALMDRYGLVCVWSRGARYWILRSLLAAARRQLAPVGKEGAMSGRRDERGAGRKPSSWRKWLGYIDMLIDPHVGWMVPEKYQTAASMVFTRGGHARSYD